MMIATEDPFRGLLELEVTPEFVRGHGERSRLQLLFKLGGTENWLLTCWLFTFGC